MGNSKHFMAILAAVEKLQPTGIVLAGWCTDTQLNRLFILQKDALYQVVCIYFKSAMCFVTIPLLDTAPLFCLEVTAAKDTKELFIISIIFKII